MSMSKKVSKTALLVSLVLSNGIYAEEGDFDTAMKGSETKLSFRARYEMVDQEGLAEKANAITNRTRLTFASKSFGKWKLNLEMDNVSALTNDYNSTANGQAAYPVVADPEGTDLNQANLVYSDGDLKAIVGRQRINIGSQRLVGGVGWRQNEQTYDGVLVSYKINDNFNAAYAYIDNVNRIFGPTGGNADVWGANHVINANYKLDDNHSFAFTSVMIDLDNAAGLSTDTHSLEYKGKYDNADWTVGFATQSDAGLAPVAYTADYSLFEFNYKFEAVSVGFGIETLGSDNGVRAFITPLATLHKFQGFADKFAAGTPNAGVEDTYFKVGGKLNDINLSLTYHQLDADFGGGSYGTEIDIAASYSISKTYGLLVKYADYQADANAGGAQGTDVSKLWVMFTANF